MKGKKQKKGRRHMDLEDEQSILNPETNFEFHGDIKRYKSTELVETIFTEPITLLENTPNLSTKLVHWYEQNNVTQKQLDELLKVLNSEHIDVPISAKGLLSEMPAEYSNTDDHENQNLIEYDMNNAQSHNSGELASIDKRLTKLESKIDALVELNGMILASVEKLCRNSVVELPVIEFPIKYVEQLEMVEKKVAENPEKYIKQFKEICSPGGILANVERIFSTELIMNMNYAGVFSKQALSVYDCLNSALYESLRKEGYSFDDYISEVRRAFHMVKNRTYKKMCVAKKAKINRSKSP